jgi:hypothetical protein
MTAATSALNVRAEAADRYSVASRSARANQFMGLAAASLLPALFWAGIAVAAGHAVGVSLSLNMLTGIGASIALFLGVICAPMILKD